MSCNDFRSILSNENKNEEEKLFYFSVLADDMFDGMFEALEGGEGNSND